MAIEVLKRGIIPEKEQTFTVHCPHCRSQLRFKSADARREEIPGGSNQFERPFLKYHIICPVCDQAIFATSDK